MTTCGRGDKQVDMHRLAGHLNSAKAYVLDSVRHVAKDCWEGGSKMKLRKNFGGCL